MAEGIISTDNSTTALLGGGGTFTGEWEDKHHLASVTTVTFADVASAAAGLVFEWSNDGVTVHHSVARTVAVGVADIYESQILGSWFRIRYTNGATPQGAFDLQTIFRDFASSSRAIVVDIKDGFGDSIMDPALNAARVSIAAGGGAVTVADGADVNAGATTDAANTTGAAGTISGKQRGLLTILVNAWDSVRSFFRVSPWCLQAGFTSYVPMRVRTASAFHTSWDDSIVTQSVPYMVEPGTSTYRLAEHLFIRTDIIDLYDVGVGGPGIGVHGAAAANLPMSINTNTARLNYIRTPCVFRTVQAAAAGNTVLWTPTAGRKFRLMRYMVGVTGDASTAGGAVVLISLFDGGAGITNQVHPVFCPAVALGGAALYISPWIDMGNGHLSVMANNLLNVNLSAALATGTAFVIVDGTEET